MTDSECCCSCLALNNLAINTKQLPTWEVSSGVSAWLVSRGVGCQAEASEHISIMIMKKRYADNKAIQQ